MSKFFCIGHFKTGTSSYSQAMAMLGLRDLHFPRRYIQAMHDAGRVVPWTDVAWDSMSNVHEQPGEWRALRARYKDARFILTLRDENAWLSSIQKHMGRAWPPDLARLFDERFLRVFGVPCRPDAFEEGWFRAHFRQQHEMAREMIPGDRLLVIDLDQPEADHMAALASFVGRGVRYPHVNRRRDRKPGEPLVVGGRNDYMEVA